MSGPLTLLSLFTGYGGLDMGVAEALEHPVRTVAVSDIEPRPQAVGCHHAGGRDGGGPSGCGRGRLALPEHVAGRVAGGHEDRHAKRPVELSEGCGRNITPQAHGLGERARRPVRRRVQSGGCGPRGRACPAVDCTRPVRVRQPHVRPAWQGAARGGGARKPSPPRSVCATGMRRAGRTRVSCAARAADCPCSSVRVVVCSRTRNAWMARSPCRQSARWAVCWAT